jgi:multiple sugar transport system substrate-binding protein
MTEIPTNASRRRLLKSAGAAALIAGIAPGIASQPARGQQKTLKILQWKHFVPGYDKWFNETYVRKWGADNNTQVIVDHVGLADIDGRARAEAVAQRGHDMVLFIEPPSVYEDHVIDHREIYEESERLYGKAALFAVKSTYNPYTRKYFGYCPYYAPAVTTYRKDLWDAVGTTPDSWEKILDGGRKIKLLREKPVGLSLAPEHNSEHTVRAIMYSFGSSEQDPDGKPALKSKATMEAIKYAKALYEEAMPKDVPEWDAASNNRFMLNDEGCLTLDTLSIARASENLKLPITSELRLAKTPQGPAARLGPSFGMLTFIIWNFAENIEGAKRFLVDYTANLRPGLLASGFQNMPSFPDSVPDLGTLVDHDPAAGPSGRYRLLAEAPAWTTNMGHPGHTNPAIAEVYKKGLMPTMFARAATGRLTPEQALDQADAELRRIFQKWKESGKV